MTMTPRERVLSAINHEEPDRVPIVIGVSNATGIKMKTYRDIKELVGIDAPDNYMYEWPELGTAEIDEATMQRLHSDVRGVRDRHPLETLRCNLEREPHSPFIDSWGNFRGDNRNNIYYQCAKRSIEKNIGCYCFNVFDL